MDEHKHGALTDVALDREIDSLLAIDPSPEFMARVRARVATEAPRASWFRWESAAAAVGVAAAIVATTVLWPSSGPSGSTSERGPTSVVVERIAPPDVRLPEPERAVTSQASAAEPLRRNQRPRVQRASGVDVSNLIVVAPEDARAFDQLLASIREPDVVLVLNEDRSELPPLSAPSLPNDPIVIEPVPVAPLEGGVE